MRTLMALWMVAVMSGCTLVGATVVGAGDEAFGNGDHVSRDAAIGAAVGAVIDYAVLYAYGRGLAALGN